MPTVHTSEYVKAKWGLVRFNSMCVFNTTRTLLRYRTN